MKLAVKMTKKRWIALIVVIILIASIGGCYMQAANYKPALTATTAGKQELKSYLSTSGVVTNGTLDEYILPASTVVQSVNFEVGDTVKAGDVMVVFDNSDAQDDYKRAAIAYEKVRLQLDDAERQFFDTKEEIKELEEDIAWLKEKMDEWEDYSDPDSMAKYSNYYSRWESAKAKKETLENSIPSDESLKIQQLTYEEAKMTMDEAEEALAKLPANFTAQHDGVIESITVSKYGQAAKGQVAVTVRTTDTTTVDIRVGRFDINKIEEGQPAVITVANVDYEGSVSYINPIADAESYVKVQVKIDNPEGIIPGLDADVDILTYAAESVLALPSESVKTDRNGDYCYVLTPSPEDPSLYTPVRTYITTDHSSGTLIEVTDGLEEGQLVVTNPPANIDAIPVCTATLLS